MSAAPRKPLLSVAEALERLLRDVVPLGKEVVALAGAHRRILAEDLLALRTQPPFPASAMDGYAVRHADLVQGKLLTVIGEAAAGHGFSGDFGDGEAVRIFTGAPVPSGADTVLIQENAENRPDGTITATDIPPHASHVRPAGLDFGKGDVLLPAGRELDAGALCLAAAGNHANVKVWRRPVVGILATGDELLPPGSEVGPAQIIASNAFGVAAIAQSAGATTIDLGIAGDSEDALLDAVARAKDADVDLLVTLGGASVGEHDLIKPVFEKAGMVLDFWKIAMRPGKPFMAGRLGDMAVAGLPGNPVSSLICAHLFVAPLVGRLGGRLIAAGAAQAILDAPIGANGDREHYMRASARHDESGTIHVTAFDDQDSSIISNYANAHVLIIRPPHDSARSAGESVNVRLLRTF